MARLVDNSLLMLMPGPAGSRYRMLETIRQFGNERMVEADEESAVRGRHLSWCLEISAGLKDSSDIPRFR